MKSKFSVSSWIHWRALALASAAGGLMLWAQQLLCLSKPFVPLAFPVLLAPLCAIVSTVAILGMILPAWLMLRGRASWNRPARFAFLAGFGWYLLGSALRLATNLLVEESAGGLLLFGAWVGITAYLYAYRACDRSSDTPENFLESN